MLGTFGRDVVEEAGLSANRPLPIPAVTHEADLIDALEDGLVASGSGSHEFVAGIAGGAKISRETLADVLHLLGLLHGTRPSVFEIVHQSPLAPSLEWLSAAARSFARERDLLSQLVMAAGPPPSRAGQTGVEIAVDATRNALVTLAGSDRLGCAVGAAVALLMDWETISTALRRISISMDIKPIDRHGEWPNRKESLAVIKAAASVPGGERAVRFGFQTLLAQHFAFWNIVQSRAD